MTTVDKITPAMWATPVQNKTTNDLVRRTATAIPMTATKNVTQTRRHQVILNDLVTRYRCQKDELFYQLIEVARAEPPFSIEQAWKTLLKKMEEYFHGETTWCLCCKSLEKRQRQEFFEKPDKNMLCAIHHAVLHNNIYVVQKLIEKHGCDANIRCYNHETVLHLIARAQCIWEDDKPSVSISEDDKPSKAKPEIIDYLLKKTKERDPKALDAFDDEHRTPLHHAVLHKREDYVKWLIEAGASTLVFSTLNASPLHFACFSASDDSACLRMIKIILKVPKGIAAVSADPVHPQLVSKTNSMGLTAVCGAALKGFSKSIKYLLPLSGYSIHEHETRQMELEYAVRSNHPAILRAIYEKHQYYCNASKGDETIQLYLLHLAAKFNNNRMVIRGISREDDDSFGKDQTKDYVSDIIRREYDKDGCASLSPEKYTPVLVAAYFGNKAFIEYIIDSDGNNYRYINETTADNRKMNVLHICAERSAPKSDDEEQNDNKEQDDKNKKKEDDKKVKKDEDSSDRYADICDLLLSSSKKNNSFSNAQRELLKAGDIDKNTPLHLAAKYGSSKVFLCLLDYGKKLSDEPGSGLKKPVYGVNVPVNRTNRTPLHECAKHNRLSLIKELLLFDGNKKQLLDTTKDENLLTAVHLACRHGHLDMVKYLVEKHHASVNTIADKRETPLFSACEKGHQLLVKYLLDKTDADPTVRTARGLNCLDVAIEKHHPEIVQYLLDHPQWRRLMESAQYDGRNVPITPMRRLIISMPEIAYDLIDKRLTTVVGGENQPVHLVTYDYTYFDDHYNIPKWVQVERHDESQSALIEWWKKTGFEYGIPDYPRTYTDDSYTLIRNHPLMLMAQCQRMRLMSHDYCTQLRKTKFRRFSVYFFSLIFLIYLFFIALYTVVILQTKNPKYYYDLYNASGNTSGDIINWDYGFDSGLCKRVGTYLVQSGNVEARKTTVQQGAIWALGVFLIVFLAKNVLLILACTPRWLRKMAYYLEGLALILSFIYVHDDTSWQSSLNFRCPIQWELGSIGLLFCWLSLLSYMRYIPWYNIGLYVVMLDVIFVKFLKAIPLLMVLFCGFGFTYHMLLQYQTVYGTPLESIFRTAMSLFDLGYEARLYTPPDGVMYYPAIYFVFILTEIILTILITNLLIGLAVGEIPTLKTQAKLHRNIMLYELFSDYEILHLQLKRIARNILSRIRNYGCSRCCCSNVTPGYQKPSAWLCEVHVKDTIEDDQTEASQIFPIRWYNWLAAKISEDDIQSSITIEKRYKKLHRIVKEESEEEDDD